MKKLLIVSKLVDAKNFIPIFQSQGAEVAQTEDFKEALEIAQEWKPGVIVFLVPVYWESILDFVKEVRATEGMENAGLIYIGKLIEGAELRLLQNMNVKTMALGPVPEEEMARFIMGEFPAW